MNFILIFFLEIGKNRQCLLIEDIVLKLNLKILDHHKIFPLTFCPVFRKKKEVFKEEDMH